MVDAFDEVEFPAIIARGSTSSPRYSTYVTSLASGAERRNQNWSAALSKFNAKNGIETMEDLSDLINFFHARAGRARGFRFKDWADYTTHTNNMDAPTAVDHLLGVGDGVIVAFQLRKFYVSGAISREYTIYKPVTGTVLVSLNDVPQGSGWTVDTTTGIITFSVAPANGVNVKAGCEFRKPARFDADEIPVSLTNFRAGAIDCPMVEVIPC